MSNRQNKKTTQREKQYDFTLSTDKSKQDVRDYFNKYGWAKTVKQLRKTVGKETIIGRFQFTKYIFKHYNGMVGIVEDTVSPFTKKIHFID